MALSKNSVALTFSVALVLFSVAAATAQAQTAQKIIDLHIKARGGTKALKSVTSVKLSGTVNGNGEFLWQTNVPSAYYLEVRHGDTHAVEAFNGKSAWREDRTAGVRTLTGREQARARSTAVHRNDRFLNYKKDKTRVNLLGQETVEGRTAYAVEVTTAAAVRRKVFFDVETYLILKEEQEREGGTEEILFGDYRAVDGVQEPHLIRIRRGAETLALAVAEAAHNLSLDAALFDFPRGDVTPLPDVPTFFQQVLDNENKLEREREDYTYTKTENAIEVDGKGRIKEKAERTYEVFYVGGRIVEKLVATNGQPLPPDEARKEQDRVAKVFRERERKATEKKDKKDKEERKKVEKEAGEDDDVTAAEILRVCQFVNPRRERFRGREVVVYDFEPRSNAKPRGRVQSWIQKLVGNVWIDEHAERIVRLEARVSTVIRMAGGLVLSLQRGSSFVFERELVRGEVWLPSYAEVNASARVLLVKGFKVNQTQRFSDYKKFNVETSSEIKPPKQ